MLTQCIPNPCFATSLTYTRPVSFNLKINKSDLKKEFQERFFALRKILSSWDLIPGSPKDEFDSSIHKITNHLYKGADFEKITRVLSRELINREPLGEIIRRFIFFLVLKF